ncbi:secretion-regulating guanine nucleotide exchange factor-like isoform X1 [Aphidius gifuensis]|uniref:secretion-regulating guanine nucleotide exchange factor-like isoform X1 n=1 Tax=Aphidius gifuensis TaxID=684658 RepID=UPI001CDC9F6B|nr:secretion-regulating guanine nucleotide exchange factor-like isoform X1 [Aphidius gifuensis]
MTDFELFAWGANSHGQLGLGYESEQSLLPEKIDIKETNIKIDEIIKITGGGGHTLILDKNGNVYSCGWNKKMQTGIPGGETISKLQKIENLNNIIDIACGWDSSMALTETGDIYVWGSNTYGQLGLESPEEFINKPIKIQLPNFRVKKISMGLRHSAIVTHDGQVFVTGSNNKHQLGIVNDDNVKIKQIKKFTKVLEIENIIDVSCGQYFNIALSNNNCVYSWGDNKQGQLGFDNNKIKYHDKPVKIIFDIDIKNIISISSGWTHSSVLTTDGKIYSWGRNIYGQLGFNARNNYWQAKCVENLRIIKQLKVGSEHNITIDDNNIISSWGWNEHGNCGNGNTQDIFKPTQIIFPSGFEGFLIGCGAGHSFAVMKKI